MEGGKSHWLVAREEMVHAKGKGAVQTFWVFPKRSLSHKGSSKSDHTNNSFSSVISNFSQDENDDKLLADMGATSTVTAKMQNMMENKRDKLSPQLKRLVDWNVDLLSKLLKNVIAGRGGATRSNTILTMVNPVTRRSSCRNPPAVLAEFSNYRNGFFNPRSEYSETIELPRFDDKSATKMVKAESILLDNEVEHQLWNYVATIACAYCDNRKSTQRYNCPIFDAANK
jgi:hypothetical protein